MKGELRRSSEPVVFVPLEEKPPMDNRRVIIGVKVPPKVKEDISALSKIRDVTMSSLIASLIEEEIARNRWAIEDFKGRYEKKQ